MLREPRIAGATAASFLTWDIKHVAHASHGMDEFCIETIIYFRPYPADGDSFGEPLLEIVTDLDFVLDNQDSHGHPSYFRRPHTSPPDMFKISSHLLPAR